MKKLGAIGRLLWCMFALLLGAHVYAQPKSDKATQKEKQGTTKSVGASVYQKNVPSVVLIEVENSGGRTQQGSGVAFLNGFSKNAEGQFLASSTWIATNAHLVKNAKVVNVVVDGFQVKGEVWFRDQDMDIALITLNATVLKPAKIPENTTSVAAGNTVFAIGAPVGSTRSITEGIVSASRTINGVRLIQTSAPISAKSSGGGLFSATGHLLGVTTFKVVGGESLNFAIEISQVIALYEAHWAVQIIKFNVDPKYWPTFDDSFTKWVYSASGENGGTVLDEYQDAG